MITDEIERLAFRIQKLLDAGWRSVRVVTDHGWLFCPDGLPTAELPKHLTASKWARCAAIKGDSQVPVPTAAWSWNTSEKFATPNGSRLFQHRWIQLLCPRRHQPAGMPHPSAGRL